MNLFDIVADSFFRPLTSKYKSMYVDCLMIIYDAYHSEYSFGIEKEIIVEKLSFYFEEMGNELIEFDDEEVTDDARAKANAVIRELIRCGWIELEHGNDYSVTVNLFDYAATMIESLQTIIRDEEVEYQSLISNIYTTLNSIEAYQKPYQYVIKSVCDNTNNLIVSLKKLNTTIKKRIDNITKDKTPEQILADLFDYHQVVWSKAYHRIKTSDNISKFRLSILEKLRAILDDEEIFTKSIDGYMKIEEVDDREKAEAELQAKIYQVIAAFNNFDQIIGEIDEKHSRYVRSSVARAKFLINNSNSLEDRLKQILDFLAREFNQTDDKDLNAEASTMLLECFNVFPQNFIDNDSLYVMPISREQGEIETLANLETISLDYIEKNKAKVYQRYKNHFSKKTINEYVLEFLADKKLALASTLSLENKRDFIRLIFINLYGNNKNSQYKIKQLNDTVQINGYQFKNFEIIRK